MAVHALAAAKRICEQSGWSLSNLELQKILYIAHMYYLGKTEIPLVTGHFEAWDYGPVNPAVYHEAKVFGRSPVGNIFHDVEDLGDSDEREILDEVVQVFADHTPGRLVAITHWDKGAWAKNYTPGMRNNLISNKDIIQEFKDRTNASRQKEPSK